MRFKIFFFFFLGNCCFQGQKWTFNQAIGQYTAVFVSERIKTWAGGLSENDLSKKNPQNGIWYPKIKINDCITLHGTVQLKSGENKGGTLTRL